MAGSTHAISAGGHIYLGGHFDLVGGPNADPKINPTPTGEDA